MKTPIKDIIKHYNDSNTKMKMDSVTQNDLSIISTSNCKLLWLHIGINIYSSQYGQILGGFLYIPTNSIYKFRYNVHKPNQKYSCLSNKMISISQITEKTYYANNANITLLEEQDTNFAKQAFWLHTPYNTLNKEEKDLKDLMINITTYSRSKNLCALFRKLDKKYLSIKKGD